MELLARYDAVPACCDIFVPFGGPSSCPAAPPGLAVAESATVYRCRHPEQTAFYQLFDKHFDDYVYAYEERFEAKAGPLRSVVRPTVEAFLDCGRLYGGFARIRCPSCHDEHLLAFSCQTRNFCPSCQAKRSLLFAEKLQEKILQPVPHRHYAFSIPKVLRGLLERERSLLSLLSQASYQSILKSFQELFHRKDIRPGSVTSIQTFGSFAANFNPHCHGLVTEGVFTPQGEFLPLPTPATYILADIEERFRKLLLKRLHRAERLSETFMNKLLEWNPSGFSVHAEQLVYDDQTQKLENLALYLTRAPVKLSSITQTPEGQVCVTTPPHPLTGNTVLVLDALDWIHAICQQIPDRGQHLYRYYGAYSNRTRKALPQNNLTQTRVTFPELPESDFDKPSPDSSSSRASWARLIRKVFEVDPLLCGKCGAEMKIIAVLTDPKVVDRIILHLQQTDPATAPRAPPPISHLLD
jgi:hypothetical protein